MHNRIELSDLNPHRECANLLCDTRRLRSRNLGRPQGIEEGGLAVVNVPHNADYRRPWGQAIRQFFRHNRPLHVPVP